MSIYLSIYLCVYLLILPGLLPAVGCSLLKESSCWFEAGLGLTRLLAPLPEIRPIQTDIELTWIL